MSFRRVLSEAFQGFKGHPVYMHRRSRSNGGAGKEYILKRKSNKCVKQINILVSICFPGWSEAGFYKNGYVFGRSRQKRRLSSICPGKPQHCNDENLSKHTKQTSNKRRSIVDKLQTFFCGLFFYIDADGTWCVSDVHKTNGKGQ